MFYFRVVIYGVEAVVKMADKHGLNYDVRELKLGASFTNNRASQYHTIKCKTCTTLYIMRVTCNKYKLYTQIFTITYLCHII